MRRLLFFFLLATVLPAAAQYPNRTVTMLTGYPAGGLVDIVARMVAENMKPRFPAGLVVINRPGAAGSVAVGELTRAALCRRFAQIAEAYRELISASEPPARAASAR